MNSKRLPATVVLAIALLLSGGCGAADDRDGDMSSPPTATAKAELIEYDQQEDGVLITKATDVAELKGAPDDFKQFIAGIIDALKTPPDHDCQVTVRVSKVDTSGYAKGSILSCGGAVYIWSKRDGAWQEIWSGQELPNCADMRKYSVPKPIAGDSCYEGQKKVDYTA
jgi:hypothetical protein